MESVSLIIFTLLVPASVGLWLMSEMVMSPFGDHAVRLSLRKKVLITVLSLHTLGLAMSFTHLGSPLHAWHALRNLSSSWLSREILLAGIYFGMLALYGLLLYRFPGRNSLRKLTYEVSLGIGAALLYAMIRLYMLPVLPAWNHPATPVSLITLTVGLGSILMAALLQNKSRLSSGKMLLIAMVAFSLNGFNRLWLLLTGVWEVNLLVIGYFVLLLVSLLFAFLLLRKEDVGKSVYVLLLLYGLTALLERICFFEAFIRIGL